MPVGAVTPDDVAGTLEPDTPGSFTAPAHPDTDVTPPASPTPTRRRAPVVTPPPPVSRPSAAADLNRGSRTPGEALPARPRPICALCHFCEVHGPRVVMCTEATPAAHLRGGEDDGSEGSASSFGFNGSMLGTGVCSSEHSGHSRSTASPGPAGTAPASPKVAALCQGCGWTSEDSCFLSSDPATGTQFRSSKGLRDPARFGRIGRACVRSLSCETASTREGPLFFGDPASGHTFSYGFCLPDPEARGQQRRYSIVVVSEDKAELIACFSFLADTVQRLVSRLKAAAANRRLSHRLSHRPAGMAAAGGSTGTSTSAPTSPTKPDPPRAGGTSAPTSPAKPDARAGGIASRLSLRPGQLRSRNRLRVRSLHSIVGTADAFNELHKQFIWILKGATGRRLAWQQPPPPPLCAPGWGTKPASRPEHDRAGGDPAPNTGVGVGVGMGADRALPVADGPGSPSPGASEVGADADVQRAAQAVAGPDPPPAPWPALTPGVAVAEELNVPPETDAFFDKVPPPPAYYTDAISQDVARLATESLLEGERACLPHAIPFEVFVKH